MGQESDTGFGILLVGKRLWFNFFFKTETVKNIVVPKIKKKPENKLYKLVDYSSNISEIETIIKITNYYDV